jgi:formate C-acetyltransferase
MGLIMPGEEISDMWAAVVNLLLPLELTINNGQPFHNPMPIPMKTVAQAAYDSFDQFLHTFEGYLREIIDYCIERNHESTLEIARKSPNPFLSALIGGCIEKRCDRLAGGARYHTKIVEAFGLVNVSDSLEVIKRLVFDKPHYSLAELRDAAKNDFKDSGLLLKTISSIPKYGNDDHDADRMVSTLARMFSRSVTRTLDDIYCYVPSFHTLNAHIGAGSKTAASLDGRLEGEPLAKNIGTRPGISQQGLTALMRSATVIDQTSFAGGQALDISIDSNTIRTPEGRRKFQALLNTYFQLGGLQVQVNALSPQILRQAMKVPESYRDILVRIAGYTDRFVRLDPRVQKEMINRFENGL